jgi:hypothetical protein
MLFPLLSYIALIVAAMMLPANATPALFVLAAAVVLLLFIGIHNAWDLVLFTAFELLPPQNTSQDEQGSCADSSTKVQVPLSVGKTKKICTIFMARQIESGLFPQRRFGRMSGSYCAS